MMKRISLEKIYGNPDQPRKTFDEAKLRELASSIRENGLKQPITVRADDQGRFMIVMGERRFRAHLILAESGDATDILCHVSKADDEQLGIDAIIENDQRVDVHPLEQADSYQRMIDQFGYTLETLAVKLGKPPHRISERLRLLKLTPECRQLFSTGNISAESTWYLSGLSERGQSKLLKAINAGLCPNAGSLRAVSEQIAEEEAQGSMFGEGEAPPPPSKSEISAAKGFEAKVNAVTSMLNAGIDENMITAVKKVNPGRAGTLADILEASQKDIKRIVEALRAVAATQIDMEEAA